MAEEWISLSCPEAESVLIYNIALPSLLCFALKFRCFAVSSLCFAGISSRCLVVNFPCFAVSFVYVSTLVGHRNFLLSLQLVDRIAFWARIVSPLFISKFLVFIFYASSSRLRRIHAALHALGVLFARTKKSRQRKLIANWHNVFRFNVNIVVWYLVK